MFRYTELRKTTDTVRENFLLILFTLGALSRMALTPILNLIAHSFWQMLLLTPLGLLSAKNTIVISDRGQARNLVTLQFLELSHLQRILMQT